MNFAKSNKRSKIILFILSIICFLTASAVMSSPSKVKADTIDGATYFTCTNASSSLVKESGVGRFDFAVQNGSVIEIKNKLALNDLLLTAKASDKITKITLTTEYNSLYVHGAKKVVGEQTEYNKEVSSVLALTLNSATDNIDLNGIKGTKALTASEGKYALELGFKTANNVVTAVVNGEQIANSQEYFKIAGKDKNVATIKLAFEVEENATEQVFSLISVNQKATEGATSKFNQTFTTDEEGNFTNAYPVVSISDNDLAKNINAGLEKISVISGYKSSFAVTPYSLLGDVKVADLYLAKGTEVADKGEIFVPNVSKPTYLVFNKLDSEATVDVTFKVVSSKLSAGESYAEYNATVTNADADATAPIYNANQDALDSYKQAIEKATKTERTISGEVKDFYLMAGEQFSVPSMENLVADDVTPYTDLTHTMYYRTPSASGDTTSWSISISGPGKYYFWVVFKDANSNEIDKDSFVTIDENDENKIDFESTPNGAYVFSFEIKDDNPFSVSPASDKLGTGYLNVSYTFKPFEIQGYKYTESYELYYNANKNATADADGWVKVVKGAEGFTDEEIEKIAYSKLTFTPVKAGTYKLVCNIVSTNEVKSKSAAYLVTIETEPTVVKPASTWLEDNYISVIFLSVGTVLLVILLILIFKKPKEEGADLTATKPAKEEKTTAKEEK